MGELLRQKKVLTMRMNKTEKEELKAQYKTKINSL